MNLDWFFKNDGLRATQQVGISVHDRYFCSARCQICYLKGKWSKPRINCDLGLLELTMRQFSRTMVMDDLCWCYRNSPTAYDFYRSNSRLLGAPSVTDKGILAQSPQLVGIQWKELYQVSISVDFWYRETKALKECLRAFNRLYDIKVLKLIYNRRNMAQLPEVIKQLKPYCNNVILSEEFSQQEQTPDNLYEKWYHGTPYVISDMTYLFGNTFYYNIEDSMIGAGYYDLDHRFSYKDFLYHNLRHKLHLYSCYANALPDCTHQRYFEEVSSKVSVNGDYNFIPYFMLDVFNNPEFMQVPQGWLIPGSKIKPIIEVK